MIKNIIQRLYNYLQHLYQSSLYIPYDGLIDEDISSKLYLNTDDESPGYLYLRDLCESHLRPRSRL